MALNLVMLGAPGAGKGTQAERVAEARGIQKISTGDILREAQRSGTDFGERTRALLARGEFVEDEVAIAIVEGFLSGATASNGFILDGFPRTVPQAVALDGLMTEREPLIIVDIAVPEPVLVQRLSQRLVCSGCGASVATVDAGSAGRCDRCGAALTQRADDNAAVVLERLRIYQERTRPVVEFYRGRATFRSVNGMQGPDLVARDLALAIADAELVVRGGQA